MLDPLLRLGRLLRRAVAPPATGRSLAVLGHVSAAVPVVLATATRRARAPVVKATVIGTRPGRAPPVPARRRSGPGPASRPVRRPHAVVVASTVTCIIAPGRFPGRRPGANAAYRRSRCVSGLSGLWHLWWSSRGNGAGLSHQLDYARNFVNGNALSGQGGHELNRRSSRVIGAVLRRRDRAEAHGGCWRHGLRRRSRRRERERHSWYIYRRLLGRQLGLREERHACLCLNGHRRSMLHRATTGQAAKGTEHGSRCRCRCRCHQVGITLRRRRILPRNARKLVQDDVWDSRGC